MSHILESRSIYLKKYWHKTPLNYLFENFAISLEEIGCHKITIINVHSRMHNKPIKLMSMSVYLTCNVTKKRLLVDVYICDMQNKSAI